MAAINHGAVPTVDRAWAAVQAVQSAGAASKAVAGFKMAIALDPSTGNGWELPTAPARLLESYKKAKAEAKATVVADSIGAPVRLEMSVLCIWCFC